MTVAVQMRTYRRAGARLAAVILVAEPSRIAAMTIGEFLLQIPYVDRDLAGSWLARAGVSPWRRGDRLSHRERHLIAGQLARYSA